jgi:PAS domain S-box-containing protein
MENTYAGYEAYVKERKEVIRKWGDIGLPRRSPVPKGFDLSAAVLVNAIPDMLFRMNRYGVCTDFKGSIDDMLFQNQEIIGRNYKDITPPNFADLVQDYIDLTLSSKELQEFDYELDVPGKGLRAYNARMVAVDENEVVTIVRDVTEIRKAEKQLKESEAQLRKLNATKDKFFSLIAHDLKSPFNAIIGFSDLLSEQVKNKDYNGLEEMIEYIRSSSHQAFDLLSNLLVWSRSQIGQIESIPVHLDLSEQVNETINFCQKISHIKDIKITASVAGDSTVFCDREMTCSVLRNLIVNAIKFSFPGSIISIHVEADNDYVTVSVSDKGVGISKKNATRLFHIDESVSTPGTNGESGTGLGLILCKDFIERQHGRIWFESEEGQGSTFYFSLPVD